MLKTSLGFIIRSEFVSKPFILFNEFHTCFYGISYLSRVFFQKLALKKRAKILPVSTLIVIFLFKSSVFLNLIYLESFRMRESREQMSHDFIKLESDSTKEIISMTFQKFNIDGVCRVFFLVTH